MNKIFAPFFVFIFNRNTLNVRMPWMLLLSIMKTEKILLLYFVVHFCQKSLSFWCHILLIVSKIIRIQYKFGENVPKNS